MKRAFRRKYHYIYRTTCTVTGKYYIGMHSTDNLEDGYVGSGKKLWYSINKHGKENHVCEILEHYFIREWLREREAELVNEELMNDPLCMNLKVGGEGGFDHINATMTSEARSERSRIAGRQGGKVTSKINFTKEARAKATLTRQANGSLKTKGTTGYKHLPETKQKMSNARRGEQNSSFGTCWVCNEAEVKKIKIDELETYANNGWVRGRKFVWML